MTPVGPAPFSGFIRDRPPGSQWPAIRPDSLPLAAHLIGTLGPIVMRGTQALPICLVPEEDHVALMGLDVVHHCSACDPAFLPAHDTVRVVEEV